MPLNRDSALVIFDRTNRTGAGIVFKVYTQDSKHTIIIPSVPAGKYYVTIQCMGLHNDRFEKVIRIYSRKRKMLHIRLQDSEEFFKEKVVIPAFKPNLMMLAYAKSR